MIKWNEHTSTKTNQGIEVGFGDQIDCDFKR